MNTNNAERFFNKFQKEMSEIRVVNGKTLLDIYRNNTEFTAAVIDIINSIIKKDFHLEAQNEYFRIDAVGWSSKYATVKEEAKNVGINPHLWDLKIVVEHENSIKDWTDEMIKLIHVKCPLKVVIGYNSCDLRDEAKDNIKSDVEKLSVVAKWMSNVEAFSQGKEEYLVILGNAKGKDDYDTFDYRGYVYDWDNNRFIRIG